MLNILCKKVVASHDESPIKIKRDFYIKPVANAHILLRPVEITIRGSIPRTGKTKMK